MTRAFAASDGEHRATAEGRPFVQSLFGERRKFLILTGAIWLCWICLYAAPYVLIVSRISLYGLLGFVLSGISGFILSLLILGGVIRTLATQGRHAILIVSAGTLTLGVIQSFLDIAIFDFVSALGNLTIWTSFPYASRWADNFAAFAFQFSLLAVTFWTLERAEMHRARDLELQRAKIAATEANHAATVARLAALRYQLNPHFLFNTLNSISSLVITGRNDQAEEMLSRLADFLRVTLESESCGQTLEHELETVAAYLAIEQTRIGDRLAIDITCPPDLRDCEMPNFILQPLVENAIKHGVADQSRVVTIRIEAARNGEDIVIVIEDDGSPGAVSRGGTGIGLRNVRERLNALYGERGQLEAVRRDAGFLSIVRLPYKHHMVS
ncbi:sensor histidine kinase [Sphingopyxis jiangsuensis]|uniref:sensor histidine kinase n=1 Tax=Sphingopyxis jiangsuensis TaxID=2871171 RepID=UPI001F003E0A|nr:histidine kinase [Sphingopyxis lutea]